MVWRLLKLTKPQIEINLLKVLIKNGTTTMLTGKKVTGFQTINKDLYYFNDKGQQVRGAFFTIGDKHYFASKDTGAVLRNAFYHDTSTDHYGDFSETIYYAGSDGAFKTGWFEVDGNRLLR